MRMPSEIVEPTSNDLLEAQFRYEAWQDGQGAVSVREEMVRLQALNIALQRGIEERQRAICVLSETSA